ncbi:hypothetical protein Vretimale_11203 [Volvox reticuliferus]|uniref:Uncharacterized protein n=1 Tax=Volvox reticuliferus TaxID=1737510 RepID=A0A8J4CN51_9CHLO|nr:hypothetical protein Vretifemale_12256 [Volvox reticuliferus]GIM06982.1 hypothetical protein Vretimale_11203 [Volvox reticuliferus]
MHNATGSTNGMLLGGFGNTSSSALSPSTPLGIVPEKATLARQIRRTVPAQYWGLSLASASVPDGALVSSVSDPAPLPLLAGSGLSRPHLTLATQAIKLPGRPPLPGLPSVCHDQGGLVLDRIIAHGSGDSWWAALSGRARIGRLIAQRADLAAAAADPANYSLCATSRVQLSRNTVLRTRLDWCPPASTSSTSSASWLVRRRAPPDDLSVTETPAAGSGESRAGWAAVPLSLSCQMQSRVGRWAEVRLDLAAGQRSATCALFNSGAAAVGCGNGADGLAAVTDGEQGLNQQALRSSPPGGPACAVTIPLLLGLQAGSTASSRSPLVWRCGVLQVTAPPTLPLTGSNGSTDVTPKVADGGPSGPALQSAMYIQGTIALQGERVLWQGPKRPPHRRSCKEAGNGAAAMSAASGPGSTTSATALVPTGGPLVAMSPVVPASVGPGTLIPGRPGAAGYSLPSADSGEEDEEVDDEDEEGAMAPYTYAQGVAGGTGGTAGKALRPSRTPGVGLAGSGAATAAGGDSAGAGGVVSSSGAATAATLPLGIELPAAGTVHEALMDITQSVSRLRDGVTTTTQWVGNGGLVEQLTAVGASKRQAVSRPHPDGLAAPTPWSSFVGEPHVKVAGVAGVTARTPIIRVNHGSTAPGAGGVAASFRPVWLAWFQDLGLSHVLRRHGRGADDDGGSGMPVDDDAAEGAGGSRSAMGPEAARGALRPFASMAASVQAGRFSGWLLDFTRVAAQLDCGLWGPNTKSCEGNCAAGSGGRLRHPAFALGDVGAWHALSLSLSQQVIGPLRFVADWRYQLASGNPLALPPPTQVAPAAQIRNAASAAAAAGSWFGSAAGALASHTGGMRPQLLDAVYALDLAVPGLKGTARLVAWYSPQRREGMVELRMF